MRIGVTFDLRADYLAMGYGEEETAEFDAPETIDAICRALAGLGFEPVRIGNIRNLAEALARGERYDGVFNICEGLKGVAREAQVPALLDGYDIPYVFSDPLTLALALDKSMAKRVVRDHGIATPDFALVERLSDLKKITLAFPLFLKPYSEGSGKGVDIHSKVDDMAGLEHSAAYLLERFRQPVLVEEFLPGREFTIGITGTGDDAVIFGISEIVPTEAFVGHGYGFHNKEFWTDKVIIRLCDDAEGHAAADVALASWRALRCRDGGRIDIRNDAKGRANFIEVNPLAGIRPDYSDLCLIANFQGIPYQDLIGRIMNSFLKRNPELMSRHRAAA